MKVGVQEASGILGISKNTIRALCNRGLLPYTRNASNYRRFDLDDLLKFKNEKFQIEKRGQQLGRQLFYLSQKRENNDD